MLKGAPESVDLKELASELLQAVAPELAALQDRFGSQAIQVLEGQTQTEISFPVVTWPVKVASINAEKTPDVSGVLQGIKGQYLILDSGVINMRKYTGYDVTVTLN